MSSSKSSSSATATLIVAGSALGIAAATSAYRLANKSEKLSHQETSSSFLDPAYQYLLQYWQSATSRESVQMLRSKTLCQGRVSDDGDTAEITKTPSLSSEDEDESITTRGEEDASSNSNADRVLVLHKDDDIPRSIEATPRSTMSNMSAQPSNHSQTPALVATSIMAMLLLAASFIQEYGTESVMTRLVELQALFVAFVV